MRDKRSGWRLVVATGAFAVLATACDTAGPTEDGGTRVEDGADEDGATEGGTDDGQGAPDPDDYCADASDVPVRWAHEQEPESLHFDDPANNLWITSWIQQGMLEGLYGTTETTEFVPELLAEEGEVTDNGDGTFTYDFVLRDGIQWSDGEPITGQTIRDNYDLFMDGYDLETGDATDVVYALSSREGYRQIDPDGWEVDGQSFSYTTEGFYGGWPSLFSRVLPTHVLGDAATANEALVEFTLDGEPLPASGPFQMASWERGSSTTLVRNDAYHGANVDRNDEVVNPGVACAAGVEIRWVTDTAVQINALRAGEADFIFTQPQVEFGEALADDPSFTLASAAGPSYEHWSLNLANLHLADPDVREALAFAIDKRVIVETLYTPLFGDVLPAAGLGNTYWLPDSPYYVDHQGDAGYGVGDVDAANALLEGSGYTLNGDTWEHPERGPLTLRVATTGGNELRERQQQLLQQQLTAVGWDIEIDNAPGVEFFTGQVFSPEAVACSVAGGQEGATVVLANGDEATADCSVVDIAQFAWVGGPWPGIGDVKDRAGSENNPHAYGNEVLDVLLDECAATVDVDEQGDCYNEVDRYVTTRGIDDDGLIIIPLTQKPQFYAYANRTLARGAVAPDAIDAGPLVYGADFIPSR